MGLRHETALAQAIAGTTGAPADDPHCAALAHFALEAPRTARSRADDHERVAHAFGLLERGWTAVSPG
jgi:hypothetical protein